MHKKATLLSCPTWELSQVRYFKHPIRAHVPTNAAEGLRQTNRTRIQYPGRSIHSSFRWTGSRSQPGCSKNRCHFVDWKPAFPRQPSLSITTLPSPFPAAHQTTYDNENITHGRKRWRIPLQKLTRGKHWRQNIIDDNFIFTWPQENKPYSIWEQRAVYGWWRNTRDRIPSSRH